MMNATDVSPGKRLVDVDTNSTEIVSQNLITHT